MQDRAMQALYLHALDPIAETLADPNSYGFRKERSCADAMEQCATVLSNGTRPQWILEGDIKSGASKSLRRFSPIFGAWSCLELLSSHGNHGYVAVERQSRFVPSLPKRPLCLLIVL